MAQAEKAIRLGDWLLDRGLVTPTQLDLALREQKRKGWLLGQALAELGFVTQETLSQFLAQKTQTESVDLASLYISPEMVKLVPEPLARRLVAVPVSRENNTLTVAISDPLNVTAFDVLEQTTRLQVNLVAAPEGDILLAIERLYASGQTVEEIVDELLKLGSDKLAHTTEQDAPMIRLVDRIIAAGVTSGSSDIHIHPEEKILRVRLRRDGVLTSGYLVPKEIQPALIARLKIIGGMDIAENRRPQGGRANANVASREVGLRFSTLPTAFGESIVIRILDRSNVSLNLKALGFEPDVERDFRAVLERPHGVILVTGPTGSGKTVSLYTGLHILNKEDTNISTAEDPAEINLPGVNQVNVNNKVGLTFAAALRSFLRQDPDVVMVGEIRDLETAEIAIKAAQTGHLVLSTLHTNDAPQTLSRLIDMGVKPYAIATSVSLIIAQRLARRLCVNCKQLIDVPAEALRKEGFQEQDIAAGMKIYGPKGCQSCTDGYKGRVGLYQVMEVSEAIGRIIMTGGNAIDIADQAAKEGVWDLRRAGLEKVRAGMTSIAEINSVTIE